MAIKLDSVEQAMAMARAYVKKGDTLHAGRIYQAILTRYPNNKRAKTALHKLQVGGPNRKQVDPSQQDIARFRALLQARKLTDALKLAEGLARQFPSSANVHNMIGTTLTLLKRHDDAIRALSRAQSLQPNDTDILNNLAGAYFETEQYAEAYQAYTAAIKLRPDYAGAYSNRAKVGLAAQRIDGAIQDAMRSLELDPGDISTELTLGRAQARNFELEAALASFERVLAQKPDLMPARLERAGALVALGRLDQARVAYGEILATNPLEVNAHFAISKLTKYTADDPHIAQMRELAEQGDLSARQRSQLFFTLGKIYERLGATTDAFDCYHQGNQLRDHENAYSITDDIRGFQRLRAYFQNTPPAPLPPSKDTTRATPIFILGMPRSGTTLTEQIISSHSQVHGAGELQAMGLAVGKWFNSDREPPIGADARTMLKTVRRSYLNDPHVAAAQGPFVTDKMPANFRHIGVIAAAFPDAPIIHLQRNPMAVCWSIYRQSFQTKGLQYAYDLENLGRYFRLYQDMMGFWHRQLPGRIYDLNYETLTQNQEQETRKLIAHCGLDWEDACLTFHENTRSISTASATQVRRKMYTGSSQDWEDYAEKLVTLREVLNGPVPQAD